MRSKPWLAGCAAAALLLGAPALARAEAPSLRPAIAPDGFDAKVAAAKAAMMADPAQALQRAQEAMAAARAGRADPVRAEQVATAQWLQGEALVRLSRPAEAAPVIDQALAAVAARAPNSKLHGDLTVSRAEVRAAQGDVQAALVGFQQAYRIFGLAKQPRSQAMALMHIGSIYQDAGDYPKVLEYYAQAAETYPEDLALTITAENNVGEALRSLKRYPEAVAAYEKARGIARRMGSRQLDAEILTNLALAEVEQGRIDAAQRHLDEDLRIARTDPGAREEEPFIWGVAAKAQMARRNPAGAAQLLERTFEGVDLATSPPPFRDFHKTAFEAYSQLGDEHRALAHLKAYKRLDDQARELAASTNAALMAARFDFANQKTRIAQLKAGQLQRDIQLARAGNLIAIGLLIGASLIAVLFAVSFFWIRRSRNEVREANAALSDANGALEKALRARTEFLATTSHEIRTPLNGILGMTQVILSRSRGLDADTREKIALVHGAGETMRALVDDILDIAKIETEGVVLNRAELDLPQLCRETVALWADRARGKGLALTLSADGAPARIVEDAGRLRQILFNLMSNAVKFTDEGGVTLSVSVEEPMVEDPSDTEHLRITVADTGVGIPPEKLEEVFESFRQGDSSTSRSYEGTGLGLAICRKLAQAMGGDILLESAVGAGSTVTVRVPLTRSAAEVQAPADRPQGLAECRVLICDANPLTQAVVKASLAPKGRLVEAVGSPSEAETAGASGRFDLVVVDAGALGGERQARLSALRRLATAVTPAEVVLLTPEVGEDEAGRLLGAGAVQLIRKPIAAAALAGELQAGFEARAQAAGSPENGAASAG
jgi:signal transduction histidine kinase